MTSRRAGVSRSQLLLVAIVIVAAVAPALAPYDPLTVIDPLTMRSQSPSWSHWMGTDALSRDILSRVLVGLRTSVGIAAGTVAIAAIIALGVGVGSGMAGGWIDRIAMRLTDLMLALPRAVLLLALSGWVGALGAVPLTLLLGATGWMALARLLRSEVQTLRTLDYVDAARALGASPAVLVMRHVVPALIPLLVASCALAFADALLLEAALSFLGVGVQPPLPSLGTVLLEVSDVVGPSRWLAVGPGLVLLSLTLAVHAAADRATTERRDGGSHGTFAL